MLPAKVAAGWVFGAKGAGGEHPQFLIGVSVELHSMATRPRAIAPAALRQAA